MTGKNEKRTLKSMDKNTMTSVWNGTAACEFGLEHAARIIVRSGLVTFPTETVYGLGVNAFDASVVARIFEIKNRPAFEPLIVNVAGIKQASACVEMIPEAAFDEGEVLSATVNDRLRRAAATAKQVA